VESRVQSQKAILP